MEVHFIYICLQINDQNGENIPASTLEQVVVTDDEIENNSCDNSNQEYEAGNIYTLMCPCQITNKTLRNNPLKHIHAYYISYFRGLRTHT